MLKLIRKNKTSFISIFIIGVIALLMAGFGMEGMLGGRSAGAVVTVGGEEVPYRLIKQRYDRLANQLRQQYPQQFGQIAALFNLPQKAVDGIIDEMVLSAFYSDLGLSVGAVQKRQHLQEQDIFKNTPLTKESYTQFINSVGVSDSEFQHMLEQQILGEQVRLLFTHLNRPTEHELKELIERESTSRDLLVARIPFDHYVDSIEVTEEELAEFYQETSEAYSIPRAVSYRFIPFTADSAAGTVDVYEEDIQEEYDRSKRNYRLPEKFNLRRIHVAEVDSTGPLESMVRGSEDISQTGSSSLPAIQQAKALAERLDGQTTFSQLSQEISQGSDPSLTVEDLGWISAENLRANIVNALAELQAGETTNALVTDNGAAIYLLEEREAARQQTLKEVRDEVRQAVQQREAPTYALSQAEVAYEQLKNSGLNLEEFAEKNKLSLEESGGFLTAGQAPPGAIPALTEEAINYSAGSTTIVSDNRDSYIVEVTEIRERRIPTLDEVREKVLSTYREKKSKEKAKATLEALIQEIGAEKQFPSLEEAAKARSLSTEILEKQKEQSAPTGVLGQPEVKQLAFSLDSETSLARKVFQDQSSYFLVALLKLHKEDSSAAEKNKEALLKQAAERAGFRIFQSLLIQLKAQTDIEVNPELLQSLG